jgi:TolB protein
MRKTLLILLLVFLAGSACQASPPAIPTETTIIETAVPASEPAFTQTSQADTSSNSTPSAAKSAGGVIVFYSDRDGNPEIYSIRPDGSGLTRLTHDPGFDDSPAISPDGTRIAFLTARHDPSPRFPNLKYELYIMDMDGGNPQRLTVTETAEGHPAWSPDGSRILFDADYDADGFAEIYTIEPDGSNLMRLTSSAANDQFADWSPDGAQIAFSSDRNGNWDIFVMNADSSNQRPLTDGPDWELFPAWSPDGTHIAFNGLVPNSGNTDVYVMNADGSNIRQLTDTPRFDENPAWSPGGSQIAFQTNRDGNFEIYLMNADGSDQHPLAPNAYDEMWPSWSGANTQTLSFQENNQEFTSHGTLQAGLSYQDIFVGRLVRRFQIWFNLIIDQGY